MAVLLSVLVALGLGITLYGEVSGGFPVRAAGKILASTAFVALGLTLGLPGASPHGPWIVVALLFSWVGDVALLSSEKRWFLLGLVAFLLGHVGYAVAFLGLGVAPVAALMALGPLAAFAMVVWEQLRDHVGSLGGPVVAYIAVISAMVALAAGTVEAHGPGLLVAATLFFLSDLFVARQRFVAEGVENRLVGLPLYFGAQVVFCWAAAAVG